MECKALCPNQNEKQLTYNTDVTLAMSQQPLRSSPRLASRRSRNLHLLQYVHVVLTSNRGTVAFAMMITSLRTRRSELRNTYGSFWAKDLSVVDEAGNARVSGGNEKDRLTVAAIIHRQ